MKSFVTHVRNSKTPQPIQKSFTLDKWGKAFNNTNNSSEEDKRLYESGIWAFDKLEKIRQKLIPFDLSKISPDLITKLLVAISNRSGQILHYASIPRSEGDVYFAEQSIQGRLGKINRVNPNITPDMAATSSVDSLRFPLKELFFRRKNKSSDTSNIETPDAEIMQKLHGTIILAQFYDVIYGIWMDCLWNNRYITRFSNHDLATEPQDDFSRVDAVSAYRRQALMGQLVFGMNELWQSFPEAYKEDWRKYFPQIITKGSGKKMKFDVRASKTDKGFSRHLFYNRFFADKGYYAPFFNEELTKLPGITLNDLLRFWEIISSLCDAHLNKFPSPENQNHINTTDELSVYAPTLYYDQTKKLLKKWLHFSDKKIEDIFNFFTYDPDSKSELWGKPLIKADSQRFYGLWIPLLDGNMERTIELWMKEGGFDFGRHGFLYEDYARNNLINSLAQSRVLVNSKVFPKSLILETNSGKEEIDLVIQIGNVFLLGEIKSLLFPSEPIEKYRYFEVMKDAANQIKRKLDLAQRNKQDFIEQLNIDSKTLKKDIEIYPFILVNQPYGAGCVLEEVPVVDLLMLQLYFDGSWDQFVLFHGNKPSVPGKRNKFYNSESQAAEGIFKYLLDPPQIRHYKNGISFEDYRLPEINADDKPFVNRSVEVKLPIPSINFELRKKMINALE